MAVLAVAALAVAALLAGVLVNRLWLPPRDNGRHAPVLRSEIDLTTEPADHRIDGTNPSARRWLSVRTGVSSSGPPSDGAITRAGFQVRRLDTGEVAPISGAGDATQPFFSPDGRWIGFMNWDGPDRFGCARSPSREGSRRSR